VGLRNGYPRCDVTFYDADGVLTWQLFAATAFTKPYQDPASAVTIPCLAPGERCVFAGSDYRQIDVSRFTKVHFDLSSIRIVGAVSHPKAPTVSGVGMEMTHDSNAYDWARTQGRASSGGACIVETR
jgi:hypothetical protein